MAERLKSVGLYQAPAKLGQSVGAVRVVAVGNLARAAERCAAERSEAACGRTALAQEEDGVAGLASASVRGAGRTVLRAVAPAEVQRAVRPDLRIVRTHLRLHVRSERRPDDLAERLLVTFKVVLFVAVVCSGGDVFVLARRNA